jgi:hypothetical protein
MAGCMMCATAAPQSTMIHSPFSSPSMRGLGKPASRTASRTLAASALVCRLEVPDATMTRSNSGERCSVLKTWMSCALTSSSPSTMARWRRWVSFLSLVAWVIRWERKGCGGQYSLRRRPEPAGGCPARQPRARIWVALTGMLGSSTATQRPGGSREVSNGGASGPGRARAATASVARPMMAALSCQPCSASAWSAPITSSSSAPGASARSSRKVSTV